MLFGTEAGELHDRAYQGLRSLKLDNFFSDDHLGSFCLLKFQAALLAFREVQEKLLFFNQGKLPIN